MTRIDKSESQNIAEAAQPLEERDLGQAIADHRLLYKSETGILKLHQRDGESGMGPPFNPAFEGFLSLEAAMDPERARMLRAMGIQPDHPSPAFPWSRALFWMRHRVCRDSHAEHVRDEWDGALCHALVNLVIRHEYSLDAARLKLELPHEGKSRRTLDSALLTIEKRLEDQLAGEKQRQTPVHRDPAEWMAPAHVHEPLDGAHAAECENPVCRMRRAA